MMQWVTHGPDLSPAFILAEQGYDVWLGNNRGNVFSHMHLTIDPDSKEFMDFYQEEMARYDVPTFLNHVISVTG